MNHAPALVVSIPSPSDRHDALVRDRIGPVLRALEASGTRHSAWFERVNKPFWALRVHVVGAAPWLDAKGRPLLHRGLGVSEDGAAFAEEDPEDKWVGGVRERGRLEAFHHHDTRACVAALEAEARGDLPSRANFSLLLVERFLDRLGLHGEARLDFYRRGFDWAVEMGRWDAAVFESLEATFASQRQGLSALLAAGDDGAAPEGWGTAEAERIAGTLLRGVTEPLEALAAGQADARIGGGLLDFALFASHAHSNRFGINASREAALRYLVWRARGGGPARAS